MAATNTFTLAQDAKKKDWVLIEAGKTRAKKRFAKKTDATDKAVREAVGAAGGTVKVMKSDGTVQKTIAVAAARKHLLRKKQ